jgi:hypothetical protein
MGYSPFWSLGGSVTTKRNYKESFSSYKDASLVEVACTWWWYFRNNEVRIIHDQMNNYPFLWRSLSQVVGERKRIIRKEKRRCEQRKAQHGACHHVQAAYESSKRIAHKASYSNSFLLFKRSRVGVRSELIIWEWLPKDLFLGYRIGCSKVFLNTATRGYDPVSMIQV